MSTYTYTTKDATEIGRNPQGLRANVTVWVAAGYRDHTPYQPYAVAAVTFVVR